MIEGQHQTVTTLLTRERGKLDRLAACLLEQEVADHGKMHELLGPRSQPSGDETGMAQSRRAVSPIAASQVMAPRFIQHT